MPGGSRTAFQANCATGEHFIAVVHAVAVAIHPGAVFRTAWVQSTDAFPPVGEAVLIAIGQIVQEEPFFPA